MTWHAVTVQSDCNQQRFTVFIWEVWTSIPPHNFGSCPQETVHSSISLRAKSNSIFGIWVMRRTMSEAGLGRPMTIEERASLASAFETFLETIRIPNHWGRVGYLLQLDLQQMFSGGSCTMRYDCHSAFGYGPPRLDLLYVPPGAPLPSRVDWLTVSFFYFVRFFCQSNYFLCSI